MFGEKTKLSILDTLGVMVPPSSLDETCGRLAEIVMEESGSGRSTMIGLGKKGTAVMAAYLNGSFAHVLDYDDTIDDLGHHPSAQTVPAALAVAERLGNVTGRELIAAVALGSDLGARLSASPTGKLGVDHRWFPISNFGVFSATAAAGKLLRLNESQLINALGLALHRCHGQARCRRGAGVRVACDPGRLHQQGGGAVRVAGGEWRQGMPQRDRAVFENYYDNRFDAERLLSGLGEEYRHAGVSLKPWPCCRLTHGYVEATRKIIARNGIEAANIGQITLVVPEGTRHLFCEPEAEKRAPTLSIQAKFSLYFTVAVGVVKAPRIADFLPANLQRPDVLDVIRRVQHRVGDDLGPAAEITPAIVEVRTTDGAVYSHRLDNVYGHPDSPMSDEDVIAKFKDCLQYARHPLPEHQVDRLIDMLLHLDAVQDVSDASALLP